MPLDPIARLRRFNRAVTREVGALETSFLGRGRPLGVARVLSMVSETGTDVALIRQTLDLDSGLLSRILHSLESQGLIAVLHDGADRRRRIARLTETGVAEQDAYETLNNDRADRTLGLAAQHSDQLLAAMDLIATVLNRHHVTISEADPEDPAALACLSAYFDVLVARIDGISRSHVPLPDPEADSYRPPHGVFLLAWSDGIPLGCVSLHRLAPGEGEVKRLWIAPDARGQGLARRLMRAVESHARTLGLKRLKLDTNAALTEAIALYRSDGWVEIPSYTGYPATHWFEKRM